MEKQRYYVYYTTTSSFSPEEKKHLHDLFGRDFFHKGNDGKQVAPPTNVSLVWTDVHLVPRPYPVIQPMILKNQEWPGVRATVGVHQF